MSSVNSKEGLTFCKVKRFASLPFSSEKTSTYLSVKRFSEISAERLQADGIQGILLDADGVLGPQDCLEFPEENVRHTLDLIAHGLKVAIYTNGDDDRFDQFTGIPVVRNVPAKPDPKGFEYAVSQILEMNDPSNVCMVGDNYVTDGGAVDAGLKFIYVEPIPNGAEKLIHRITRRFALFCAKQSSLR